MRRSGLQLLAALALAVLAGVFLARRMVGPIQALVHNAATGVIRPALETEDKHWDWTLAANARALLSLARAAAPLRDRLIDIEAEMTALREEKQEIESILRKTDQLPRKNGKPKKTAPAVAPETLERFFQQLDGLDVGTRFWASVLVEDNRFDFMSASHISKALAALHEQGRIALHSKGIGGRKVYTVVR